VNGVLPRRVGDRPLIKMCGLRRTDDLMAAREAGADLLGMVFAPSRRQLSLAEARAVLEEADSYSPLMDSVGESTRTPPQGCTSWERETPTSGYPPHLVGDGDEQDARAPRRGREAVDFANRILVGVFVNQSVEIMNEAVRTLGLGLIQLSGDEPPTLAAALEAPYLKVIHLQEGGTAEDALRRMDDWPHAAAFLLDSWSAQGGGSGERADWTVAAEIIRRAPAPVFLAGGLHPENVSEALVRTAPWGVDVSSGIERDGWKDSARMRAFVRAARGGGV
jgi:phosphoribosylanthranilate isomerase